MKLYEMGYVKSKTGDVGIEIEVEGLEPLPTMDSEYWMSKKEDSLRNHGMEYITKGPLKRGERLKEAVTLACKKINVRKTVKNCPRTSIHVHVNVSNYTLTQIVTGVTAFWLVENLLARYCGEDRESNLFCLRLKDAEGVLDLFSKSLDGNAPFSRLNNHVRYAGLNTSALTMHGSLEVRLKGGTTDPEEIIEWANEMHNLFQNASTLFKSPEELFDFYLERGARALIPTLFSGWFAAKLMGVTTFWEELVEENAMLLFDLAYTKKWDTWEKKVEEVYKPPNKKDSPMYAITSGTSGGTLTSYINAITSTPASYDIDE